MKTHEECIVCGAREFITAFKCIDHLVSSKEFSIMRCKACGFMFTQGIPEPAQIGAYYESPEYISHTGGRKSLTDILYGISRSIMLRHKTGIVKKFTNTAKGTILDIGAGTGHFVMQMQKIGWNALGVEISDNARRHATEINEISLIPSLKEGNFAENSFDAITMWHVLEHIHEPEVYLNNLCTILKKGGILIIALPNPESTDARHYKNNWAAYDVPRHLWHFSINHINTLTSRAGLRPVAVKRMPLDAFYIAILSERHRQSRFALIKGLLKGSYFWLAAAISKEKCSSLIHIYIKN
jgi:2-polyprenyl-3-methyl-5-hydroxy-6-metoxy-1,4-benzoquinol methylase